MQKSTRKTNYRATLLPRRRAYISCDKLLVNCNNESFGFLVRLKKQTAHISLTSKPLFYPC